MFWPWPWFLVGTQRRLLRSYSWPKPSLLNREEQDYLRGEVGQVSRGTGVGIFMLGGVFKTEILRDHLGGLPLRLRRLRIHLQCGRPGFDPCVAKILCRKKQLPTPVFWPGEFHALYRLWGRKELDTTERLSLGGGD